MASRRHIVAFNRAVRARGLDERGVYGPVIELGRDLARDLDANGLRARSTAAYQAVLREMRRWPLEPRGEAAGADREPAPSVAETAPSAEVSEFEKFKRRRGPRD